MFHHPSPNLEPRPDGQVPSLVVLHGTWTTDIHQTLSFLTDDNPSRAGGRVSCHYVIDQDGTLYQLVEEGQRAWHAGAAYWRGIEDVNSASIGIELQNRGAGDPYTEDQIESLCVLLRDITARYGLNSESIIAHSDIAPARKDDPDYHFPWRALAVRGFAVWPDETTAAPAMVQDLLNSEAHMMNALHGWGYDPRVAPDLVLMAFDRHFVPEAFENPGGNAVNELRARRLAALWAMKMGL